MTAAKPDDGAWHGPLPQLPEKWAATPGQAAAEAYYAAHGAEHPRSGWKYYGESEREAWEITARAGHDVIAAQDARSAPDARRALLDIIAEVDHLDEPGPAADYIRLLAEYGLGEAAHPGDSTEPKPAPELAAAMRETRQLRNIIGTLIDLFDEPDHRNMRHASVTKSTLTRYAAEAGVKP